MIWIAITVVLAVVYPFMAGWSLRHQGQLPEGDRPDEPDRSGDTDEWLLHTHDRRACGCDRCVWDAEMGCAIVLALAWPATWVLLGIVPLGRHSWRAVCLTVSALLAAPRALFRLGAGQL